uniref:Uncharacterized protein n=1 Tax=Siphovirus contig89 TaxID=1518022 RepID=A0A075EH88_9CAUD|nr:hypothetical protein [Siphovirus contig89]
MLPSSNCHPINLVVDNAVDVEVEDELGDLTSEDRVVVAVVEYLEVAELDDSVAVLVVVDPTHHGTGRGRRQAEALVHIIQEQIPTSPQDVIGVVLLSVEDHEAIVLVPLPGFRVLVEHDSIGRDAELTHELLRLELELTPRLVVVVHLRLVKGVGVSLGENTLGLLLTEALLDTVLVVAEGLLETGVGHGQTRNPVCGNAVRQDQRNGGGCTQAQR